VSITLKSRWIHDFVDAVRSPNDQLTRGQKFIRQSWQLAAYCWRQLQFHRAEGMAAELTYRTVFSLIPVVVLGLVMFRIVGGLEEVQDKVENQLYSFFGVPEIPDAYLTPLAREPAEAIVESSNSLDSGQTTSTYEDPTINQATKDAAIDELRREAQANIRRKLHELTSMVTSIDFKSIGAFGLILFIYAAIALADSVEHLFNRIYDAPSQRPAHLRLAIHWSIITLGSGLLALSLYMSGQVIEWTGKVGADSGTRWILSHVLSVAASWVLMFLMYALMPNTHVAVRAAMIGSLVAALLWEVAKFGFKIYVIKAVPYSNIYGSIGLIPLFLFWIYITWLIVLFGLILTYTLQTFGGHLPRRLRQRQGVVLQGDPDWMLPIMCEVGRAFRHGKAINRQELADQIGLSSREVHEMTEQLVNANLLRPVAGEGDCLTLARPAECVSIVDILNLAHHVRPTNDHPAWKTLASLKQAERDAAIGKTLADLVV
jgi:membrane protein